MAYFRIRKEWNGGKWTRDQIGAYTSLESAKEHITDENIANGYKIFSPEGAIVYPISYPPVIQSLYDENVLTDRDYWSNVVGGKEVASAQNLEILFNNFLAALGSKPDGRASAIRANSGRGEIVGVIFDPQLFEVRYIDACKLKMQGMEGYALFNLGYFGNYKESGQLFTLPGANLVADIDVVDIPEVALKYLRERKLTDDGKLYFSAFENVGQFNKYKVSTLIVDKDNNVSMQKVNTVSNDRIKYAISGAPVIWEGKQSIDYRSEGWDTSIGRATTHGVLGLKNNRIVYLRIKTTSSNCMAGELYNKIREYELDYAIKVDGGGSYYSRINNCEHYTSENRRINNIGIVRL